MTTDERKTLKMLEWAKNIASEDEVVAMFWKELCKAVRQPTMALPSRVLSELKLYGGNSIANTWRGEGVAYSEIAYDVAKILQGFFEDRKFSKTNVESCEAYILQKMEVKEDDISKICEAMKEKGMKVAGKFQKEKITGKAVVEAAIIAVAKQAAKRAMVEASKQVTKKAAQKVAQEAAKQVARQVFIRIIATLNIVLAALTVVDIAGPARRVIIPGVTYVALLRHIHQRTIKGL